MKPPKNIKIVLVTLIIPMLLGCGGGKLSRGKAEEIIKNSIKFPKTEAVRIANTYMMNTNGNVTETYGGGRETKEMHDFFVKKQLMTIARSWSTDGFWNNIVTGFTDEGKKYATDIEEVQAWSGHAIKLCDKVFNEITGIQINEQTKVATVEYSLKRTNWTPFGEYFKEKQPAKYPEIIAGQRATLQKYDDGWRMSTTSGYE